MTTNTAIDDPLAEFATLPPDAQQELLKLYAVCELMLPEERRAYGAAQAAMAEGLEMLGVWPLSHRANIAIIYLLTTASLADILAEREEL